MTNSRVSVAVVIASLAVVVAACGSGAATAAPAASDSPVATAAPAESTAPSEGPASAAAASCEVTPDATGAAATISGFAFPADLTVEAGSAITWTNGDSVPHTVTFSDGSCDSGSIPGGDSATVTYTVAGTYPFVCRIHPRMTGTLTVEG